MRINKHLKSIIICLILIASLTRIAYAEPIQILTNNTDDSLASFPSVNELGVIVFSSNGNFKGDNPDGGDELFVSNQSSIKQITNLGENDFIGFFRIAGRSNIIAFTTNGNPLGINADRNIEVFTIKSDGTELRQITNTQLPVQNTFVSINPNGEVTAFQCTTQNPPNFGGEAEKICLANFNGSSVVRLTEPEVFQFASPTITSFPFIMVTGQLGSHLVAFSTTKLNLVDNETEGSASFEIFTAEVDQNLNSIRFHQLTTTPKGDLLNKFTPRISEEGNVVVFVNAANKQAPDGTVTPVSRIDVINTDGSNLTMLHPNFEECGDPTLNADGSKIVFSCKADFVGQNPDKNSEIFLSNRDDTNIEQLTNTTSGDNFFPYISPTGQFIVWESTANINGQNPDGRNQIYLIGGTNQRPPVMTKPNISVPPGFSFINTIVNQVTQADFDITNTGQGALIVTGIQGPLLVSPFGIVNRPTTPFTLEEGESKKVVVSFSPTMIVGMTGEVTTTIRIFSNDPDTPVAKVKVFAKAIQSDLSGKFLKIKESTSSSEEGKVFNLEFNIRINNTGDADSGPFGVAVFLSKDPILDQGDELLKELPAANQPPKTRSIKKETIQRSESARGKFLIMHIDNLAQVNERFESNNIEASNKIK